MASRFQHIVCLECGYTLPPEPMTAACTRCGSAWLDARYTLEGVAALWQRELPTRERDLWRYHELLPIDAPHPDVYLGEGYTPLLRLRQYERLFNHNSLYVKDERRAPTSSFKDRQAALAVNAMKAAGVKEVVLASTGNAGVAYAAFCARAGIKLWLFLNGLVPADKMREAALYGAEVIRIDGTYDEAKHVAGEFAKHKGILYDKGAKSIPGKESMKTISFELAEQLGMLLHNGVRWQAPDWYIQAVSGGIGPLGVWKGFEELLALGLIDKMPKLAIVQVTGCAPMVNAHAQNAASATAVIPNTLITVLATGDPGYSYQLLHKAVSSNDGAMITVEDGEAFTALRHLAARTGLSVEPATAVAFAGLEKLFTSKRIKPNEIVVVNATGHTMPAESHILGEQYVIDLQSRREQAVSRTGEIQQVLQNLDEKVTTVLVVDDNNNDRRLMRKLLTRYKQYRMLEARSGAEALELIQDKRPDLIVTDLTMPELDGFGLLNQLKADPATAEIPMVVVSAKSLTVADAELLARHAESVWVKGDFDRRELVEHIVALLGDTPIAESQPEQARTLVESGQPIEGSLSTIKILLIEDAPNDRRLIQKILSLEGAYQLTMAVNAREGLKAIYENLPDLVLLDMHLPDMDGVTVLEKISQDRTINHIPVIVITAYDPDPQAIAQMAGRFAGFIQKGALMQGQLLAMIQDKLGQ